MIGESGLAALREWQIANGRDDALVAGAGLGRDRVRLWVKNIGGAVIPWLGG